jgi:hypothetical protein
LFFGLKKHRDNVQWYDQGSSCGVQWNDRGSSWVEDWRGFLGKTYWFVLQELVCSWGFGSHICRTYSAAALRLEIGGFRKQVVEPVNCLQLCAGKSWSSSDQVKVYTRRGSWSLEILSLYQNLVSTDSAIIDNQSSQFHLKLRGRRTHTRGRRGELPYQISAYRILTLLLFTFKTVFAISVSVLWLFLLQDSSGKKTFLIKLYCCSSLITYTPTVWQNC